MARRKELAKQAGLYCHCHLVVIVSHVACLMRNALFVRAFIFCVLYVRAVHVPRKSAVGRISTLLGAKASLSATAERKRSTGTASRIMILTLKKKKLEETGKRGDRNVP
jgi:hypothetical protein